MRPRSGALRPRHHAGVARDARGATLLVTLLLLGILALLGVSALRSAALDLVASGNEQYRARALQAAEAGLAAGIVALRSTPAGAVPAPLLAQPMPGMGGDAWDCTLLFAGDDPATFAASGGLRTGQHYSLESTGRSLRGASVALAAGVRVVRDAAGATLAIEPVYWRRHDVE
ncbi:MAG: PilX N-terminal domain-containing pilus assembly protein [Steroidobacteraceae bacterium]